MIGRRRSPADDRVVYQVAARCLDYPTAELVEQLPTCLAALGEQGDCTPVRELRWLVEHLAGEPLGDLQHDYVQTFDLNARYALYLSYWTDGDTRRRGEVLTRFQTVYRQAGAVIDTQGELPDYLPLVLEFAARVDLRAGRELLVEFRPSLELLRMNLQDKGIPYGSAVAAVCATLPGESPVDRAATMAMMGPPSEAVGLDGYGGQP